MPLLFSHQNICQKVSLYPGTYVGHVWGAQGGFCGMDNFSRGGYSNGTFMIYQVTNIIICVGGRGLSGIDASSVLGGFNGGGNGKVGSSKGCGGGGGGATDIRLSEDISSRIIVAGGGGGFGYFYSEDYPSQFDGYYPGGYGGGLNGADSYSFLEINSGRGGSQIGGGDGGRWGDSCIGVTGSPGYGGGACSISGASTGGGGGGYYGGGGGADISGGGGGSGYIADGVLHGYVLNGSQFFLDPDNNLEKGHSGDGFAIIECIQNFESSIHHEKNLFNPVFFYILLTSYFYKIAIDHNTCQE